MVRRSAAAQDRYETKKTQLETELKKYQGLIRELRSSDESRILKTRKQKEYHIKIQGLQHDLEHLKL